MPAPRMFLGGLIGLALLASGSIALADEVLTADGRPLPIPTQLPLVRDRDSIPIRVWYAHKGAKPRIKPGPASASNPEADFDDPIAFMQPFFYVLEATLARPSPAAPVKYLLLVRGNNQGTASQFVGWVDARHVVIGSGALIEPDHKIYRKAMIINSVVNLRQDQGMKAIRPRYGPEAGSEPSLLEIQLFNIFFIFGETDDSFLIGTRPEFDISRDAKDPVRTVLGWVPKSRVCPWQTREAFFWAPYDPTKPERTQPGKIYRSVEDALAALEGRDARTNFIETPATANAKLGKTLRHDQLRYPVLDFPANSSVPRAINSNEMMRVGVTGGFVTIEDNGTSEKKVILTADQVAKLQGLLTTIEQQISQVEILFVVDETESMKKQFTNVAQAIGRIIAATPAGGQSRVKIAVAYYGDTFLNQRAATPAKLQDAASRSATIINEVQNHQVQVGQQGNNVDDPEERVFFGLGEAIKGAEFSRYSRKIVILLGDAGNKLTPNDPTVEQLAQMLRVAPSIDPKNQAGYVAAQFYPIQVCDPEARDYTKAFRAEMLGLIAQVKRTFPADGLPDTSTYSTTQQSEEIINAIVARYHALEQRAADLRDEIDKFGINPANKIGPELERILREYGVPVDQLRNSKGFQIFEYGYVWKKNQDNQDQIRSWLLVTDGELRDFIDTNSKLNNSQSQQSRRSLQAFFKDVVTSAAGDRGDGRNNVGGKTNYSEAQRVITGLPFRSPIMNKVFSNGMASRLEENEFQVVIKKLSMLRDMQEGASYQYVKREVNLGGVSVDYWEKNVESRKDLSRKFNFGGDARVIWYWVDFSEEWP